MPGLLATCYAFNSANRSPPLQFVLVGEAEKERREVNRVNHRTHLHLTDRYLYDEQFRQQMYKDPIGTAESTGLPLDEEDREAISNWDMNPENDQVLKDRVSKFGTSN
jgi:hypothetical protein